MTGALLACALVSAVLRARETGAGCDVDTSLYDTACINSPTPRYGS